MVAPFVIAAVFIVAWIVAEFRAQKWVRLAFCFSGMICLVGMTAIVGLMERMELADHYRAATNNLAYAVEAANKDGQSDYVASVLNAFRNQTNFDVGTPPDYYRVIQSAADQINSHGKPGR